MKHFETKFASTDSLVNSLDSKRKKRKLKINCLFKYLFETLIWVS